MASDSSSSFWQGYHTFLYDHIKYSREGGRKRTNEQTRTWAISKRKKGSFVTLYILRASVDYRGCVFCAKLLQKPLGMPTHLWLSSLTASFSWPSFPWSAISRLASSALRCRLPLSVLLCQLLCLPSDLPFILHFRSRGRSRAQAFVWVSRQSRQRGSLTGAHTHPPTQWMAT